MKTPLPITVAQLEAALNDPRAQVLQGGRNLTVRTTLLCPGEAPLDVVIKRFPPVSPLRRLYNRLRNMPSKAVRADLAARHLYRKGYHLTPEPLAVLESPEDPTAPSWFVTRYVPNLVSFRDHLIALYTAQGPCAEIMALLQCVAEACAQLHDAGFQHCDLGNQNILLSTPEGPDAGSPKVYVLDLNRSHLYPGPLSLEQRARDLSRITLPSDFLRVFFDMYWRGTPPPRAFLKAERRYRRRFAFHSATRPLRHPFRCHRASHATATESQYPKPRELWIWDHKSQQAITTLRSRDRHRYQSLSRITLPIVALSRLLPRFPRHRRLARALTFERPVLSFAERLFVSISAEPALRDSELQAIQELGCIGVHVRLYAHEPASLTEAKLDWILHLKSLNFAVALSLVQNREAVRNPETWLAFCDHVLSRVHSAVIWVEYLHAVNRVKWGIWNFREFRALCNLLPTLKTRYPDVSWIGPAVIDFEWDYLAAALRCLPASVHLQALSSHLYIDRRGAPESCQGPHNALGKLQVFHAFAQATPNVEDHLIISEFNWPLQNSGEWSPVSSPYVSPGPRLNDPNTSEENAARYTLRYVLLALSSGLVDSMVFWSLAAHGFGLIDPGTGTQDVWRQRPAFRILKSFFSQLLHAHFVDALAKGEQGIWALRFVNQDGHNVAVLWSSNPTPTPPPALPFTPTEVLDAFGNPIDFPSSLSGDPIYCIAQPAPAARAEENN